MHRYFNRYAMLRATRVTFATLGPLSLPNQRTRGLKRCAPRAINFGSDQKNRPSTMLSFASPFQPLSLSSTASANKPAPGGTAVFCFAGAPLRGLGSSRFAGPSKKADLGTWELAHARALRVVCLERLRASKELFRCMTIP